LGSKSKGKRWKSIYKILEFERKTREVVSGYGIQAICWQNHSEAFLFSTNCLYKIIIAKVQTMSLDVGVVKR